jgi:hypothetical protein
LDSRLSQVMICLEARLLPGGCAESARYRASRSSVERKFSDWDLKMQRRSSMAQKKVADLLVEVICDRKGPY